MLNNNKCEKFNKQMKEIGFIDFITKIEFIRIYIIKAAKAVWKLALGYFSKTNRTLHSEHNKNFIVWDIDTQHDDIHEI